MMAKRWCWLLPIIGASLGCFGDDGPGDSDTETLTLATTTSTRDSGLLDVLLPMFEADAKCTFKVVAVGSGQGLEMGRRGDVDVLLTHAPKAEKEFAQEGYGNPRSVMHNDFVLVGPSGDPAQVRGEGSVCDALSRIASSESPFASRGDNSGTHMKELGLWGRAELTPAGEWYLESGSGMAATLRIANEKSAYALCDRATFLKLRGGLELELLSEGDELLRNDYSVTVIAKSKHPHVNSDLAERFVEFLISPTTQRVIANYGKQEFGQPLFFPDAI